MKLHWIRTDWKEINQGKWFEAYGNKTLFAIQKHTRKGWVLYRDTHFIGIIKTFKAAKKIAELINDNIL